MPQWPVEACDDGILVAYIKALALKDAQTQAKAAE